MNRPPGPWRLWRELQRQATAEREYTAWLTGLGITVLCGSRRKGGQMGDNHPLEYPMAVPLSVPHRPGPSPARQQAEIHKVPVGTASGDSLIGSNLPPRPDDCPKLSPIGQPQLGQAGARSDTDLEQSGHLMRATQLPYPRMPHCRGSRRFRQESA